MKCKECGNEIVIHGHWYNQHFINDYCDFKYDIHSLRNRHNLTKSYNKCVLLFIGRIPSMIIKLFVELLFDTWYVIGIPFRFLFG